VSDKTAQDALLKQQAASASRIPDWLCYAIVFVWPIIYLVEFVVPLGGHYSVIGMDFPILYYAYKLYLLGSLASGHVPLWSPSEGAGFPFYSNPFAQAFYPFNLPLLAFYKIFGGYTNLDHQIFTVLGISIFATGLYAWLRQLDISRRAVLVAVLIMSVSFRMTEIIRFTNALHTAAWHSWILFATTRILQSRSNREAVRLSALLFLFLVCLLTGGYFYYVYYFPFLGLPYFAIFLIRPLRRSLMGERPIHVKRGLIALAASTFSALLLASPYLWNIKCLLAETTDRGGTSFAYSTGNAFTVDDTLGSLVFPPAATADGWFFFGISGVLILALYLLLPQRDGKSAWVKPWFLFWIGIITYITYGERSWLFVFLWKFMPGFASLRQWGRMNIILVPILAWLLSLAYEAFERLLSGADKRPASLKPLIALLGAYAAILAIQFHYYLNAIYDPYWFQWFRHLLSHDIRFIVYGLGAFLIVAAIVCGSLRRPLDSVRLRREIAFILVLIAATETWHVGPRLWSNLKWPPRPRTPLVVPEIIQESFSVSRTDHFKTICDSPAFSVGTVPNWYYDRYIQFLRETEDEIDERRILLGVNGAQRVFFSESVDHKTVASFLDDAKRFLKVGSIEEYTGNELICLLNAPAEGYLSFIDNWDSEWTAKIDGKPAEINLLFGTFKSVFVPAGPCRIEFAYRPGIF